MTSGGEPFQPVLAHDHGPAFAGLEVPGQEQDSPRQRRPDRHRGRLRRRVHFGEGAGGFAQVALLPDKGEAAVDLASPRIEGQAGEGIGRVTSSHEDLFGRGRRLPPIPGGAGFDLFQKNPARAASDWRRSLLCEVFERFDLPPLALGRVKALAQIGAWESAGQGFTWVAGRPRALSKAARARSEPGPVAMPSVPVMSLKRSKFFGSPALSSARARSNSVSTDS